MAYKKDNIEETKMEMDTTDIALQVARDMWRKDLKVMIEGFLYMLIFLTVMQILSAIIDISIWFSIVISGVAILMVYRELRVIKAKIAEREIIINETKR